MSTLNKRVVYLLEHCALTRVLLILGSIISLQAQARPNDPEVPAIERPVHISDQGSYERPYLPVYRTTRDGRLSYNVKSNGSTLRLYLNAPEKIQNHFNNSAEGPNLLARTTSVNVGTGQLRGTNNGGGNVHSAICEVPDAQGNQRNPYPCGNDDCYDMVFIQSGSSTPSRVDRQLQGTPGTIRVRNPKTPNAFIQSVVLGDTVVSPHRFTYRQLFEISTTANGNMLIGRIENDRITWRNRRTNQNITGRYDMVYFPAPIDPSRACDVTQWDEIKPLGHAPYDPEINTTYGFAKQRFRDAQGRVVPDNNDLAGTYPWIDSEGNNIGFATLASNINFPVSCVPNRGCNNNNFGGTPPLQGKMVVGSWTRGKMVLMDNLANNIDYPQAQQEDNGHRLVDMYAAGTGPNSNSSGLVRIGHGRDNDGLAGLAANPTNTTFLESIESKLNFWENMIPSTPGDVVWHMSTGAGSDEFAFDDFSNINAVILSSMVQATENTGNTRTQFVSGNNIRVQNASTTDRWNIPAFGRVIGTRIETVAQGGIHGKGLYHDGTSRIEYQMPTQPLVVRDNDWQISLYVDARFANNQVVRSLINFPDGSELQLVGRDQVRYWDNGDVLRTINLPRAIPEDGWAHIGVQMSNRNRSATFYLNGYALDTFTANRNFFELHNGLLSVGDHATRNTNGFVGWIDDFKVIAQNTNPADWCTHANGYLAGSDNSNGVWANIAASYPASSHQRITALLQSNNEETYSNYACYVDYSDDYRARKDTIPAGFTSIRESINFPEGPVVHNEPRPNSVDNQFCLQCHTAESQGGLGLDALTFNANLTAENDPRRQPMQPAARVFGHIPADWLGEDLPRTDMVAPAEGFPIDEALLPSGNSGPLWEGTPQTPQTPQAAPQTGQIITHAGNGQNLTIGARIDNDISDIAITGNANNNASRWQIIETGEIDSRGNPYVFIQNADTQMRIQDLNGDTRLVPGNFRGDLVQWSSLRGGNRTFVFENRFTGRRLHAANNGNGAPDSVPATVRDLSVRWRLN